MKDSDAILNFVAILSNSKSSDDYFTLLSTDLRQKIFVTKPLDCVSVELLLKK
jgi:hypothetical protein